MAPFPFFGHENPAQNGSSQHFASAFSSDPIFSAVVQSSLPLAPPHAAGYLSKAECKNKFHVGEQLRISNERVMIQIFAWILRTMQIEAANRSVKKSVATDNHMCA